MSATPNPRIKLAVLREYTAQSGRQYFSGFMGPTKLLLFRDDGADIVGAEVAHWNLLVEPAPSPSSKAAATTRPAAPKPSPARAQATTGKRGVEARARASLNERGIDPDAPITDDAIGF